MRKPRITIQRSLLDKLLSRELARKETPDMPYAVDDEIEMAFMKFTTTTTTP